MAERESWPVKADGGFDFPKFKQSDWDSYFFAAVCMLRDKYPEDLERFLRLWMVLNHGRV